jgi:hypothetical protein
MSPKEKPEEVPVWYNFTISPSEKARWKAYAKKKGIPLATLIKKEVNKIINAEYHDPLQNLLNFNKDFLGVIVFQDIIHSFYKIGEIESEEDFREISRRWKPYGSRKNFEYLKQPLVVIQNNHDRLILKSKSENQECILSIIGFQLWNNMKFFARVNADGNTLVAMADLQRIASKMFPANPISEDLGILAKILPEIIQVRTQMETIEILRKIPLNQEEQVVLTKLEQRIGKPIPAIPPFFEGDIKKSNPMFETTSVMYFAVDGHICQLRMDKCNLKEIPPELAELAKLRYLTLNNNEISTIPDFLSNLESLEVLSINNNKINNLTEIVYEIPNLKELYLAGNPIAEIPRKNIEIKIPLARLTYLNMIWENNIFEFLNRIINPSSSAQYTINSNIIDELKYILKEFLVRLNQEIAEEKIDIFIHFYLAGN